MGNLTSKKLFEYNAGDRLYTILNFFFKRVTLKNSLNSSSEEKYSKFEDMLEASEVIINSIKNNTFESVILELQNDIILTNNASCNTIFINKICSFQTLNEIIKNLRIYNYETQFKFFNTESQLILSFSLFILEDSSDDEMDENHMLLMNLRNKWVKEGRLCLATGVGICGIQI